ncbi:MAG: hypothetical protein HOP13_01545 [Alphaproteobacteria bacterium]|nr:hypothetical protein [Alphaproteobacteria bacterium]
MSNPSARTPESDDLFFQGLAHGYAVGRAAEAAGYAPASVYRWRHADPDFGRTWALAQEMAVDILAEEADRRGRLGVEEPVFYQGRQVGTRRRFSDALLLARLKALSPARYRDGYLQSAATYRELDLEAELVRLVRVGRIALADLEEGPRAAVERVLAQLREVRE